jgi:hypothetical protein
MKLMKTMALYYYYIRVRVTKKGFNLGGTLNNSTFIFGPIFDGTPPILASTRRFEQSFSETIWD